MSEPITYHSQFYGQRHTALMVVRSLAIWISTVGMLTVMAAPAFFQGKEFSSSTVIGALVLFAIAQGFQTLTLLAWRIPDHRKVIWDPQSQVLTTFGFRVSSSVLWPGRMQPEFPLALREIREVTLQKGRGSHLRLKTNRGFLQLSSDLDRFTEMAELIINLVQSPPEEISSERQA